MIQELWSEVKTSIEGLSSISTKLDSVRYTAGEDTLTPTNKVIIVLHSPDPIQLVWKANNILIALSFYSSNGAEIEYVKEKIHSLFNGKPSTTTSALVFYHSGGSRVFFDDKTKMYVSNQEFTVKGTY